MTTRRDFLKSFAALTSGIVLARSTALAAITRLGTAEDWLVDGNMWPWSSPIIYTTVRAGHWSDPSVWDRGALPGRNARVYVKHDIMFSYNPDYGDKLCPPQTIEPTKLICLDSTPTSPSSLPRTSSLVSRKSLRPSSRSC